MPPLPVMPGLVKPVIIPVRFEHGGRTITAQGLVDTGASGHAFLDSSLATKIGLNLTNTVEFFGVGGEKQLGFKSIVNRMSLVDNPDCWLENVPATVGRLGFPGVDLLIGIDFLQDLGADFSFTPDGKARISCKGGKKLELSQPFPMETIALVAGLGIAGIILYLLLTRP